MMGDFVQCFRARPPRPKPRSRHIVGSWKFIPSMTQRAHRTAFENLVLLRGGYPPIGVRPQDRPADISALQDAQAGRGSAPFDRLLYERLDATLGEFLRASREALTAPTTPAPPTPQDKADKLAA